MKKFVLHKITLLTVCCLLLSILKVKGQVNLVPNPGFEIFEQCPAYFGEIGKAKYWFSPNMGTPDLYNSCAPSTSGINLPSHYSGYSFAHTGNGQAGIVIYDFSESTFREYISVKLKTPASPSVKHFISLYISLPDSMRYATNHISAFIGDSIFKNQTDTIGVLPQITFTNNTPFATKNIWYKLKSHFYVSQPGEYLYIGNFKLPINSNDTVFVGGGSSFQYNYSYYFIDDVCVTTDSLYNEQWTGVGLKSVQKEKSPIVRYNENKIFLSDIADINKANLYSIDGTNLLKGPDCTFRIGDFDISTFSSGLYLLIFSTFSDKHFKQIIIK